MYHDMKWYLPALLHVEDGTSMAFALESRAPLLDYRLVEHAVRTPGLLKMKNLEMKHIFREAVKDLLPPVIYRRTDKMGMPTPTAPWFRGPLAPWVRSELSPANLRRSGFISPQYAQQAIEEHLSGRRDRSNDLWKLLNLTAWWRVWVDEKSEIRVQKSASLAI
jgi:asparagine synthase (glutamine-hydrolysing)